jgi:hypothetical protein
MEPMKPMKPMEPMKSMAGGEKWWPDVGLSTEWGQAAIAVSELGLALKS